MWFASIATADSPSQSVVCLESGAGCRQSARNRQMVARVIDVIPSGCSECVSRKAWSQNGPDKGTEVDGENIVHSTGNAVN